jgi:branched-chain amino acid transport system substrate-binding protein
MISVLTMALMVLALGMAGVSYAQAVKEIKIGAPHPITGSMAEVGINSVRGLKLGVKHVNEAGGIKALGGAKMTVIEGDTGSTDPSMAASVARRLITENKVVAMAGCYASNMTLQASTEGERYKVPMISQSFVDKLTERGYKYYFQLPPKSSHFGNKTIEYTFDALKAAGKKVTKVACVASNDAASKLQEETVAKRVKEMGLEVVVYELYPLGITDASPIVAKIRDSKADIMIGGGIAISDVILIIRNMRALGINIPIFSTGGGAILDRGFGDGLGKAADGVLALAAWSWDLPYPGVDKVAKSYEKEYNEPFMPQEAGEMYIAAWVLKDAIEKAGKPDPVAIRDALAAYNSSTGVAGMMTGGGVKFDATGWNEKVFPVMVEWKDNIPHTVWPQKLRAMELFFK